MLNVVRGDLMSVQRGHIMHGCNIQGVMGSGVARLIRQQYPDAYMEYRRKYERDGLRLGTIIPVTYGDVVIVNAMTQDFYGRDSGVYVDYDAIQRCFAKTKQLIIESDHPFRELYMPFIGAGLGGGDPHRILSIMAAEFAHGIDATLVLL